MPELPEVETIKEAVRKTVIGATITSVVVYNRHLRTLIPHDFEKRICKTKILRIHRIAKYAVMDLDNGCSVIWHFGMSGKIKISAKDDFVLEKHDHVVIKTSKGTIIYNDPRRFGLITLCQTEALNQNPLFIDLGPDPFDSALNEAYLSKKLKKKKTSIKTVLLDQSIIAGIGNIYASEALYGARISPLRESCSLSLQEISDLIKAIKATLKKAIDAGGSTLHDYRKPNGDIGYFQLQHCVYGKEGKPCPHCTCSTKKILRIIQNNRSTYYCDKLQK